METPAQIKEMAAVKGMSIPEMSRKAGLAPSVWYRWEKGAATTVTAVQKMLDAIEAAPSPE